MIRTRRSVRAYTDRPVPDEEIKFIIDCARYAPSGFNMQPWSFLVITNKEIMRRLSEKGKRTMLNLLESFKDTSKKTSEYYAFLKTKGTDIFHGAPVLVIILGNKHSATAVYDCTMAAYTMMLAAQTRGIASCWIGGVHPAIMDEASLKELGAPEGYITVAPLIFGYAKGETPAPVREEPKVFWLR